MEERELILEQLQQRFGYRLGGLQRPAPRRAYPLRLKLTDQTVHRRLVLIGNAAHTLHPIAGQGFNLGIRDVAALAEVVGSVFRASINCGPQTGSSVIAGCIVF